MLFQQLREAAKAREQYASESQTQFSLGNSIYIIITEKSGYEKWVH